VVRLVDATIGDRLSNWLGKQVSLAVDLRHLLSSAHPRRDLG
jgi:hypothetical protein